LRRATSLTLRYDRPAAYANPPRAAGSFRTENAWRPGRPARIVRRVTRVIYRQAPESSLRQPRDGREALDWLAAGNERFADAASERQDAAAELVIEGDFGIGDFEVGTVLSRRPEPRPFGVVLGCSDSRVPIELLFGRAVNDLFVVRLAGNTIGSDAIGSIEYALRHFSTLRTVIVLGHTLCGAVAAAVEAFLKPRQYLELATSLPLRSLVDRIEVSARVASMAMQAFHGARVAKARGYPWALLDAAVFLNAAYVAYSIRSGLSAETRARVTVEYGVYDLGTRRVSSGTTAPAAFAAPPDDAEGFKSLAADLASATRILELLRDHR
jgi:carbonic anhydrase